MRPDHRSQETADHSETDRSSRDSRSNLVLFLPFPTGSALPRTATSRHEDLSAAQTARLLPERSTRAPCRARIPRSQIRLLACAPRRSAVPTLDCSADRPHGPATGISHSHPTSRSAHTPLLAVAPSRGLAAAPEVAHTTAAVRHPTRPSGQPPRSSSSSPSPTEARTGETPVDIPSLDRAAGDRTACPEWTNLSRPTGHAYRRPLASLRFPLPGTALSAPPVKQSPTRRCSADESVTPTGRCQPNRRPILPWVFSPSKVPHGPPPSPLGDSSAMLSLCRVAPHPPAASCLPVRRGHPSGGSLPRPRAGSIRAPGVCPARVVAGPGSCRPSWGS
jgi:hypothetical protein